ncbi:MAG TPA: hypothetical protein VGJ05_02240 [Fimbriiglobus sp.]|jgi:hypothetical protein
MDLATFHRLLTADGQAALALAADPLPNEASLLSHLERLRKHFDADLARAALETVLLRARAVNKFARSAEMFFTRESLEQASGEIVSAYRAGRFLPFGTLADLCCGIGGDAISLGSAGRTIVAFEIDPVRAAMAEANLRVNGIPAEVRVADVLTADVSEFAAAYCDPGRRAEGRRFLSVADYIPPPHVVVARLPSDFPLAFKLAPGVPVADAIGLGGEVEFLSVHGELKECVAWLGPLRTTARRATVLPGGETLAADSLPEPAAVAPIRDFFFVPDPTLVRAGLEDLFAVNRGLTRFHPSIAGLTGDTPVSSSFVATYRVEAVLPFHAKKLGGWLKGREIGRVTPVKCGADVDTDAMLKGWKLTGDEHRWVILTRTPKQTVAVVAERVA